MKHALIRQGFKWRANGKLHNEKTKTVTLAEMSDSHLLHVIGWVMLHPDVYSQQTLNTLLDEAAYRSDNYIFVEDYK